MRQAARTYRFPPLGQVLQHGLNGAAASGSERAEHYQRNVEGGYQDGFSSGLEAGREAGREQGYRDGLQQGRQQGLDEARAAFGALAAPVNALVDSLKAQQDEYQSVLRKDVIDLVAKVARQVIRCELALQPVQILALVDETLATMPPTPKGIEVQMNPGDLQRIRELAPERVRDWTLVADPRLESGECRVKAGHQEADAGCKQRLAACMEQISAQLLEPVAPGEAPVAAPVPQPPGLEQPHSAPAENVAAALTEAAP